MRTINPFADDANMDLEDRTLVERARAGDRDALEGLVQRHQGWIYNIAVRMLYRPEDAEDEHPEYHKHSSGGHLSEIPWRNASEVRSVEGGSKERKYPATERL